MMKCACHSFHHRNADGSLPGKTGCCSCASEATTCSGSQDGGWGVEGEGW